MGVWVRSATTGKAGQLLPTMLLVFTNNTWSSIIPVTARTATIEIWNGNIWKKIAAQASLENKNGESVWTVWNHALLSSLKRNILKGDESISIVRACWKISNTNDSSKEPFAQQSKLML
jgi:hypothetical protein